MTNNTDDAEIASEPTGREDVALLVSMDGTIEERTEDGTTVARYPSGKLESGATGGGASIDE